MAESEMAAIARKARTREIAREMHKQDGARRRRRYAGKAGQVRKACDRLCETRELLRDREQCLRQTFIHDRHSWQVAEALHEFRSSVDDFIAEVRSAAAIDAEGDVERELLNVLRAGWLPGLDTEPDTR